MDYKSVDVKGASVKLLLGKNVMSICTVLKVELYESVGFWADCLGFIFIGLIEVFGS